MFAPRALKKTLLFVFCSFFAEVAQSNAIKTFEGFVDVLGGKIWYIEHRSAARPSKDPLVVIHGGPGMSYNYLEDLSRLASQRTVVFYDQLGSYKSPAKNPSKDLWRRPRFVEELHALIEHLKLKKVVLYGQSWGGTIAVDYALAYPDRVSRLILASPLLSSAEWMKQAQALVTQLPAKDQNAIQKHQRGSPESKEYQRAIKAFTDQFIFRPKIYPKSLAFSFDHFNEEVYATLWGPNELEITGTLKDMDLTPQLGKLTLPVLITAGRYDEAGADYLEATTRRLKNGQFARFEESSHMAHLEEPENYFRALEKFLK